ncbi:MAG: class I SAM-dependent methyltransferase [Lachnospiraceae bacterium]
MELSKRLQKVADFLSPSNVICDVGCDHGYLSIYISQNKIAKKVIAMDINEGPLQQASEHVKGVGLEADIELRLSDGLHKVCVGEADAFLCAGMGGRLMTKIIVDSMDVVAQMQYAVLQPQSELAYIRAFVYEMGWSIVKEDMVFEAETEGSSEGKYYPVMRIEPGNNKMPNKLELLYGPCLISEKNAVLQAYLEKSLNHKVEILMHMEKASNSEAALLRRDELLEEIDGIKQVLQRDGY